MVIYFCLLGIYICTVYLYTNKLLRVFFSEALLYNAITNSTTVEDTTKKNKKKTFRPTKEYLKKKENKRKNYTCCKKVPIISK